MWSTHARHCPIGRSPLQSDSQGQCLSDNTTMPCSTAGMLYSLAQWGVTAFSAADYFALLCTRLAMLLSFAIVASGQGDTI